MTVDSTADDKPNSYTRTVELSTQMYKNSTMDQKIKQDKK